MISHSKLVLIPPPFFFNYSSITFLFFITFATIWCHDPQLLIPCLKLSILYLGLRYERKGSRVPISPFSQIHGRRVPGGLSTASVPWDIEGWNLEGCMWGSALRLFPFHWGPADCTSRETMLQSALARAYLGALMVQPPYNYQVIYLTKPALNPSALALAYFSPLLHLKKAFLVYLCGWLIPLESMSRDTVHSRDTWDTGSCEVHRE